MNIQAQNFIEANGIDINKFIESLNKFLIDNFADLTVPVKLTDEDYYKIVDYISYELYRQSGYLPTYDEFLIVIKELNVK